MIDKTQYITTGEFAKLMNVTKDTLFHYDKIGLFSPEIKLDNEYRYYSIYQIELLEVILMLKELGMPLKEIKEVMDHRDPESLLALFKKEEAEIDLKIKRLQAQKKLIKVQKNRITEAGKKQFDKVGIMHYEEAYYFLGRTESLNEKEIFRQISILREKYEKISSVHDYDISFTQYKKELLNGKYDNYREALLVMRTPPKRLAYQILPKGDYLVAYHKGHWNSIGKTYEKMLSYAKEHRIITEEMFIETYVIDRLLVDDYKDYITEIRVKIKE